MERERTGPVVVTGGAGFLGQEVVRQLTAEGARDIRSIDVVRGAERPHVTQYPGDIRTMDFSEAMRGASTVLHLAACQYHTPLARSTYDLPFDEVNVAGTERVLDAARSAGARKFVNVSTNMVYGLPQDLPLDEHHVTNPFGPYGQSKLAAERLCEARAHAGFDVAVVRPGLIVGPGRGGVIARVFRWVLANKPIVLVGSGANRYELIAVEDIASLVLAARQVTGYRAFNAAAKSVPRMREWIEAVIREAGSSSRIIGLPGRPLKWGFRALETVRLSPLRKDQYLIADIDYFMSAERARKELGWTPKWSGLDAAMDTFRWYRSTVAG